MNSVFTWMTPELNHAKIGRSETRKMLDPCFWAKNTNFWKLNLRIKEPDQLKTNYCHETDWHLPGYWLLRGEGTCFQRNYWHLIWHHVWRDILPFRCSRSYKRASGVWGARNRMGCPYLNSDLRALPSPDIKQCVKCDVTINKYAFQ